MRHQCLTLRTQGPGPPSRPGDTRRGDDPSGTLKLDANCHRLMCHRVLKRHPMGHEALWEWWGRGRHTQAAVNSAFSACEDRVEIIRSTQAIGWAPPPQWHRLAASPELFFGASTLGLYPHIKLLARRAQCMEQRRKHHSPS
jgi:hypothetical protein